ncbi:hypothetical protein Pcinc_000598 [Petrolisthes cinctipes]|uniref:Uncharacterized protein n=1 Tax=Petrolisthes cinctipes TaxID=88211 RepID=A0AAE1L6E8_PETCI|nr:hypothetical protein Pcinc_000598 [Petrolisthes cinctipes]
MEQLGTNSEYLKHITVALNIFFHHDSRLAVPNIGFGIGMTRSRLKKFASVLIKKVIAPLVVPAKEEEPKTHLKETDYDNGLFTNNDVTKRDSAVAAATAATSDDSCKCSCHGPQSGMMFEPSEERRAIYEEEYNKMLMSQLHLLAEFGICGYQYSLTASNDKRMLVAMQLLKERLIYTQREAVAAISWPRLLQFFLTNGEHKKNKKFALSGKSKYDLYDVKDKLYKINRRYIEHFSTIANSSIVCDRMVEYLTAKFNTIMFALGHSPDPFLQHKTSEVIKEHVQNYLSRVYTREGLYRDFERLMEDSMASVPQYMFDTAKRCMTGADYSYEYHLEKPFLACHSKRVHGLRPEDEADGGAFNPIPLFGVTDPLFEDKYIVDNTVTKTTSYRSSFKIKKDNAGFTAANISRDVLSNAKFVINRDAAKLILSGNNSCQPIFKGMGDIFKKDLVSKKPRRMDDDSPWSSKNTGLSGRNTTEFNVNSVMVVAHYELDEEGNQDPDNYDDDIYIPMVDNQRSTVQNDIKYPEIMPFNNDDDTEMIEALDFSPVYGQGPKYVAISLK